MTDYIGQQLGKYRITQLLGTGGFAEVYLGVHIHLGTEAAIKLLHTQLATPAEMEKFRQEARTIASLTHPNIVRVLDFDVEGSTPYLVMDYAPNGSLRQYLAGRPLAPAEILPYLAQVADALQHAHDKKLVHRDIKPENMLLGRRNEVLLSDFGIATVAQSTTSQKTEGVAGTAAYMAPEQIQGKARPSSDLYSLAVIVYEWLAGERPFQGTFTEVATQHLFAPPPPLHEKVPTISPLVEQVVLTALAKNPKDRFGTVRAFANAFAQASGADPAISVLSTQAAPAAPGVAPAAAQGSQPGSTVTAASQLTPHVTPQFTPQAALPSAPGAPAAPANIAPEISAAPTVISSVPEQLGNQVGPSVLFSPTQLIVPPAPLSPLPVGTGPHPAVASASFPSGPTVSEAPGAITYQPQGWAAAPGSVPFGNQGGSGPASPVLAPPVAPGAMPGGKPRRGLRVALIVLAAVLALAVVGAAGAYGLGLILHSPTGNPGSTAATVTITPAKSDVSNTFNITAVTGALDSSQNQVGARMLSATTQGYSQTVNATGQQTTSGTSASGTLAVYNFDTVNPLNLVPGDLFSNNSGCTPSSLQVVIDGNLNLPASPSPGTYTSGTVPGHVNQVGSGGNFPYLAFHSMLSHATPLSGCAYFGYTSGTCGSTYCWGIFNQGSFTGGTDPQTYPVVTQSDIDNAANSLIQANQPDAQQLLQGQLQSNERLIGTPQCTHQVSSDHNAGDQASQVTVTVTFTCTGEAYDYDSALTLAATLLENQAASSPGSGYVLVGKIKASQVSATPSSGGSVAIVVSAEGIWVYQFSASQKQDLANQIAGKNKQDAINLLAAQTGVAQVSIQITSGDGQTLPTQPDQITIDIQPVSGL